MDSTIPPPDETNETNVVDLKIRRGRAAKPAAQMTAEDEKKAVIYRHIAAVVERESFPSPIAGTPFGPRFVAVKRRGSVHKVILEVDESTGICMEVPITRVAEAILCYSMRDVFHVPGYELTPNDATQASGTWIAIARVIEMPRQLRFASDPGLCFSRVSFDPVPGPTPIFDELFSRMSNALAVKAWIGSLFIDESYLQQFVWIKGRGGDGKGSLCRVLKRIFQDSCLVKQSVPDSKADKHWAVPFFGKRLVCFSDCTEPRAPMSREIRGLTGGDPLWADRKGKDGFDFDSVCKVLFAANCYPQLSGLPADDRRTILACMGVRDSPLIPDARYEERLWLEAPAFIAECLAVYQRLCPSHGEIAQTEDGLQLRELVSSQGHEEFEAFFDEHFNLVTGTNVAREHQVTPNELQRRLSMRWGTTRAPKLAFVQWMADAKGVHKRREKNGTKVSWHYAGITAKEVRWRSSSD